MEKSRTRVVFADVRIKKPGMKVLVAQQFGFAVDGTLELFPSLAGNLLASALHRRVSVRSRSRPVGDIDGEYAADLFVADLTEHNAFPELDLRDTGQRPGRIDMNDVSMGGRQVRAQVELQAVHPLHVRRQDAQIGKRGIGGEHLLVDHGSDALERQRGHVVIAAPHFASAIVVDGNAGNPSCVAEDRFDLRLGYVPHTPRLEIVAPGIDPRQIGWSVQHAIGRPRRGIEHRQHHLHEHIADCAGAGFSRLGGHQRAGEPRRQELLVRRRALIGAHEFPPIRTFVFRETTLLATGEKLPEARPEESEFLGRNIDDGSKREENSAQKPARVGRVFREARGNPEHRHAVLSDSDARCRHEVIGDLAPIERRNAPHRVDDVLVKAGEEPKTVLARNLVVERRNSLVGEFMSTRALASVGDGYAAGLAAGDVAPLENDYLESALDQFVRGGHARHPAAQDYDPRGHFLGFRWVGQLRRR